MRGCDYYMFMPNFLSFIYCFYYKKLTQQHVLSVETQYTNIIKEHTIESHSLLSTSSDKISPYRNVFPCMINAIDVIFPINNLFGFVFCLVNKRISLNTFIFVHPSDASLS